MNQLHNYPKTPLICNPFEACNNFDIEQFLDHVDQGKFKLHERLKGMTPAQRKAFWEQIREDARARGLNVIEAEKPAKRRTKRVRRTGLHTRSRTQS